MKTAQETTIHHPKLSGIRNWFHRHGSKMKVSTVSLVKPSITIASNAAKIIIKEAFERQPSKRVVRNWEIFEFTPYDEVVRGRRLFSSEELAAAFCIAANSGDHGQQLIDRYGAHSAEQGLYIRWGNFLNIPCPGTGMDGDPNVSIFITDEIRDAVSNLLEAAAKRVENEMSAQTN